MLTRRTVATARRAALLAMLCAPWRAVPAAAEEPPPASSWVESPAVEPVPAEERNRLDQLAAQGAVPASSPRAATSRPKGTALAVLPLLLHGGVLVPLTALGAASGMVLPAVVSVGVARDASRNGLPAPAGGVSSALAVLSLVGTGGVAGGMAGAAVGHLLGAQVAMRVAHRLRSRQAAMPDAEAAPGPVEDATAWLAAIAAGVLLEHADVYALPFMGPALAADALEDPLVQALLAGRRAAGLPRTRDGLPQQAHRWLVTHATLATLAQAAGAITVLAGLGAAGAWAGAAVMGGAPWLMAVAGVATLAAASALLVTAGLGVSAALTALALPRVLASTAARTTSAQAVPSTRRTIRPGRPPSPR